MWSGDFWDDLRLINFGIFFISFVLGVYKAVFRNIAYRHAFSWDRFMNMVYTIGALYGTGEVLYQAGVMGGPRVILWTGIAMLQLWIILFRYQLKHDAEMRDVR